MRRVLLLLSTFVLLATGFAPDVRAASPGIPVTIRVAEGYYPAADTTAPYTYASEPCAVSVSTTRANAYAVLLGARANRCISSFAADDTSTGHYLRCVEARCEDIGFYWAIYLNGALTCAGVDAVTVKPKDEVAFSYEPYATALALATCEVPPT